MATSDLSPAPQKCNLNTLFKKHETKIREEQEQSSGDSARAVDIEEQCWQQVNTEVRNYLWASRLDFEKDSLLWWKAQPLKYHSILERLHKNTSVYVQQAVLQKDFSALLEMLCYYLKLP